MRGLLVNQAPRTQTIGHSPLIESIPKKNMFEAKRLNDQAVLDQKAAEECAADEAAKKEENSEGSSNSKFFNR
ncbi:hypothetical protein ACQX19_06820 [Corynebacterium diphtheriae]